MGARAGWLKYWEISISELPRSLRRGRAIPARAGRVRSGKKTAATVQTSLPGGHGRCGTITDLAEGEMNLALARLPLGRWQPKEN